MDLKITTNKQTEFINGKMGEGVNRYKFPGIKRISPGDVMYSMVTIVNNTVLHIRRKLGEWVLKVLTIRKKTAIMYGDRY